MAFKLPWLLRMRTAIPKITFGNYKRPGEAEDLTALATRMLSLPDPGMTWRDIEWLRGVWPGPLLLKGVLHPAEAAKAVGMSRQSAYALRARLDGPKFREAFEGARRMGWRARAAASRQRLQAARSRWEGPGLAALDYLRAAPSQADISGAYADMLAAQADMRAEQADMIMHEADAADP